MAVRVRPAVVGDALAIATVHVRSWQGAYPTLIPQSYLDALRPGDRLAMWQEALGHTAWPRRGTFVLVDDTVGADDDPVIGFVSIAPSREAKSRMASSTVASNRPCSRFAPLRRTDTSSGS